MQFLGGSAFDPASPGAVGSASAAAGTFTQVTATTGISGVVGSVSAAAGTFTQATATTGISGVVGSVSAAAGTFTAVSATSLGVAGNTTVGSSSASTLHFYSSAGAVAQRQSSVAPAVATTLAINSSISSSCFGFTSAQANGVIALVNELRAAAVALGLIAN